MYCGKCGAEIADNVAFCPKCGKQVKRPSTVSTENKTMSSTAPNRNLIIAGVIVALVVLLGVFIKYESGKPKTIDLNEFVTIDLYGQDGDGTAYAYLDELKLFDEFVKKATLEDGTRVDSLGKQSVQGYHLHYFMNLVGNLVLSKDQNLSNGDKITVSWYTLSKNPTKTEDYIREAFNINIKYSDFEYKVKGLE